MSLQKDYLLVFYGVAVAFAVQLIYDMFGAWGFTAKTIGGSAMLVIITILLWRPFNSINDK